MPKRKKCILLIEDNVEVRDGLEDLLADEGYRVLTADDGVEGLAKLAKGPLPDLILLDLRMPRKDGFEFRQELRALPQYGAIPILYCSANAEVFGKLSWIGPEKFIRKPFDSGELLATISALLAPIKRKTS